MRQYNDEAIEAMVKSSLIDVGIIGATPTYLKNRFTRLQEPAYADDLQTVLETLNTLSFAFPVVVVDAKAKVRGVDPESPVGTIVEITYGDDMGHETYSNLKVAENKWVEIQGSTHEFTSNDASISEFMETLDATVKVFLPDEW